MIKPDWKMKLLSALLLMATVTSEARTQLETLCLNEITMCSKEITDVQAARLKDQALANQYKAQRDDAYKQAAKEANHMPWYVWALIGGATGSLLTLRLTR